MSNNEKLFVKIHINMIDYIEMPARKQFSFFFYLFRKICYHAKYFYFMSDINRNTYLHCNSTKCLESQALPFGMHTITTLHTNQKCCKCVDFVQVPIPSFNFSPVHISYLHFICIRCATTYCLPLHPQSHSISLLKLTFH